MTLVYSSFLCTVVNRNIRPLISFINNTKGVYITVFVFLGSDIQQDLSRNEKFVVHKVYTHLMTQFDRRTENGNIVQT